jgi:hypothetical protein
MLIKSRVASAKRHIVRNLTFFIFFSSFQRRQVVRWFGQHGSVGTSDRVWNFPLLNFAFAFISIGISRSSSGGPVDTRRHRFLLDYRWGAFENRELDGIGGIELDKVADPFFWNIEQFATVVSSALAFLMSS